MILEATETEMEQQIICGDGAAENLQGFDYRRKTIRQTQTGRQQPEHKEARMFVQFATANPTQKEKYSSQIAVATPFDSFQ
jgi:hypothetical protein